jgi:hypothetical protein
VTVPAFAKVAVIETKVGRGLSPPAGRTKCQPTMPEQWLVAFTVDALPEIVVDADTSRDDRAPIATAHAAPMMSAPTGLRSREFMAFPLLFAVRRLRRSREVSTGGSTACSGQSPDLYVTTIAS